jgi:hypothetical protein
MQINHNLPCSPHLFNHKQQVIKQENSYIVVYSCLECVCCVVWEETLECIHFIPLITVTGRIANITFHVCKIFQLNQNFTKQYTKPAILVWNTKHHNIVIPRRLVSSKGSRNGNISAIENIYNTRLVQRRICR